jgi:hypothetical protein
MFKINSRAVYLLSPSLLSKFYWGFVDGNNVLVGALWNCDQMGSSFIDHKCGSAAFGRG